MTRAVRVCVFGLGEAGSLLAADLAAAGVAVSGYDPAGVATPPGVVRHGDPRAAAAGVDLVLAVTAAADAPGALAQALDAVPRGAVYADAATAAAGLKRRLAGVAEGAGLGFADVALMAPVAGTGLRTPALVSGPSARELVAFLAPLGMPVEDAGLEPGRAATRKLLRSVVVKGLTAVVMESLRAAEAAGLAGETWDNVVAQLAALDEATVRRLVEGTRRHAARRVHEMEAAGELLAELGVEARVSEAAEGWLAALEREQA